MTSNLALKLFACQWNIAFEMDELIFVYFSCTTFGGILLKFSFQNSLYFLFWVTSLVFKVSTPTTMLRLQEICTTFNRNIVETFMWKISQSLCLRLNGLWSEEILLSGDNGSSEIQIISKLKTKFRVFVIQILFEIYWIHLNNIEFALLLVNRYRWQYISFSDSLLPEFSITALKYKCSSQSNFLSVSFKGLSQMVR